MSHPQPDGRTASPNLAGQSNRRSRTRDDHSIEDARRTPGGAPIR